MKEGLSYHVIWQLFISSSILTIEQFAMKEGPLITLNDLHWFTYPKNKHLHWAEATFSFRNGISCQLSQNSATAMMIRHGKMAICFTAGHNRWEWTTAMVIRRWFRCWFHGKHRCFTTDVRHSNVWSLTVVRHEIGHFSDHRTFCGMFPVTKNIWQCKGTSQYISVIKPIWPWMNGIKHPKLVNRFIVVHTTTNNMVVEPMLSPMKEDFHLYSFW